MLNLHDHRLTHFFYGGDPFAFFEAPSADGAASNPSGTPTDIGEGEDGDQVPTSWDQIFKHPRFKELNNSNQQLKLKVREYEEAEEAQATKREEEEAQALRDREEFKTLAETTEAKLKAAKEEIKELRKQTAAYEEIAAADIEARLADYPEPLQNLLKPLLEGKDAIAKLKTLTDQAETIQALLANSGEGEKPRQKVPRGVPPTPDSDTDPEKVESAKRKNWKRTYRGQLRQGM